MNIFEYLFRYKKLNTNVKYLVCSHVIFATVLGCGIPNSTHPALISFETDREYLDDRNSVVSLISNKPIGTVIDKSVNRENDTLNISFSILEGLHSETTGQIEMKGDTISLILDRGDGVRELGLYTYTFKILDTTIVDYII